MLTYFFKDIYMWLKLKLITVSGTDVWNSAEIVTKSILTVHLIVYVVKGIQQMYWCKSELK